MPLKNWLFCHVAGWQRRASRKKRWDPSLPTEILLCSSNLCPRGHTKPGSSVLMKGVFVESLESGEPSHHSTGSGLLCAPGIGWISPPLPAPFCCVFITQVPLGPEDVHELTAPFLNNPRGVYAAWILPGCLFLSAGLVLSWSWHAWPFG